MSRGDLIVELPELRSAQGPADTGETEDSCASMSSSTAVMARSSNSGRSGELIDLRSISIKSLSIFR